MKNKIVKISNCNLVKERKSANYLKSLVVVGALFCNAHDLYSEDFASLYTVHEKGKGAVNLDFSTFSFKANTLDAGGSGYDGKYKLYSTDIRLGGNVGIGYKTELVVSAPYSIQSKSKFEFSNGTNSETKDYGFSDLTVGVKHSLYTSQDQKNEVQIHGYLTSKDAVMTYEEAILAYLYKLSDTKKIILSANYTNIKDGSNAEGVSIGMLDRITSDILFMPNISITHNNPYDIFSSSNTETLSLGLRFNTFTSWHISPEIYFSHNDGINNSTGLFNIGTGIGKGIALKIQREF